jgi:hypothetical protein
MAEHNAGQRLDFQVAHALFLPLGKIAHLRLSEFDVVEIALAHGADGALDLLRLQLERRRGPVVELLREFAHGHILARIDVGEDLLDGLAHLGVGRLNRARVYSALEIAGHKIVLFPLERR